MHGQLEEYLAEVSASLGGMPAARREEELREMRIHLLDAAATDTERGICDRGAMRNAIRQFGAPGTVAAEAMQAWRRERKLSRWSMWSAATCYIAHFLMVPALVRWHLAPTYRVPYHPTVTTFAIGMAEMTAASALVVGGLIGMLFPRRAVAGIAIGIGATRIYLTMFHHPTFLLGAPSGDDPLSHFLYIAIIIGVVFGGIPLQLAAAWMGSWLRLFLSGRYRFARV